MRSMSQEFDMMVMEFMRDTPLTAYILKQQTGAFNSATGEYLATTAEIPVQAILLDLTLRTNGDGTAPNSLIRAGDKLLYVRPPEKTDPLALPLVLNPASDRVRVGTTEYDIVIVKEINPTAANIILYELYIRK